MRDQTCRNKIRVGLRALFLLCAGCLLALSVEAAEPDGTQKENQPVQEAAADSGNNLKETELQTGEGMPQTDETEVSPTETDGASQTETGTQEEAELSQNKLALVKGKTYDLELLHASGDVVWKSSKKAVATVNSSGRVKAKKDGKCVITAECQGKDYQCTVMVGGGTKKAAANWLAQKYPVKKNQGKIVLAGSSSIRRWKTAPEMFAPYKVVRMGVGSTTPFHWLSWYKKLIVKYNPRAVVLYPGMGNAITQGYSEPETLEAVQELLTGLQKELPGVPIYFISTYPTERCEALWKKWNTCNRKIREFCKTRENLTYIDITPYLSEDGGPDASLLGNDGMHLNQKGYKVLEKYVVKKVKADLDNAKKESGKSTGKQTTASKTGKSK